MATANTTKPPTGGKLTAPSNPPATVAGKWVWPIKARRMTTTFLDPDYRATRKYWHTGIDLNNRTTSGNGDAGYRVYAVADGVVKYVAHRNAGGTWGPLVVIEHKLPDGKIVWSRYAHLQNIGVSQGQQVKAGQRIAQIGLPTTWGVKDWTAHLHFDILHTWPGTAGWWPHIHGPQTEVTRYCLDPDAYLRARGAGEP